MFASFIKKRLGMDSEPPAPPPPFQSHHTVSAEKEVAQPPPTLPPQSDQAVPASSVAAPGFSPITSPRALKQLGFFWAGAGFLMISTMITRRAVVRKIHRAAPGFFQPSHRPSIKEKNPEPLIAIEALNLATLNVISFAIMATGGVAWALDLSNIEDLRQMARRHIGGAGGRTDEDAEREIEEWAAKFLSRQNPKEKTERKLD